MATRKAGDRVTVSRRYFDDLGRRAAGHVAKRSKSIVVSTRTAITQDRGGIGSVLLTGAGFFLLSMEDMRNNKTLQKYWWGPGAVLLLVGWWLRKKGNKYGTAVMTLGAVAGVYGYRHLRQPAAATGPTAFANTAGPDQITTASGEWVTTPEGQVFVPYGVPYGAPRQQPQAVQLPQAPQRVGVGPDSAQQTLVDRIYGRAAA